MARIFCKFSRRRRPSELQQEASGKHFSPIAAMTASGSGMHSPKEAASPAFRRPGRSSPAINAKARRRSRRAFPLDLSDSFRGARPRASGGIAINKGPKPGDAPISDAKLVHTLPIVINKHRRKAHKRNNCTMRQGTGKGAAGFRPEDGFAEQPCSL